MKKLAVVIVTYNGMQWIKQTLAALKTSDYTHQVIIVDNGSTDGTREFLESLPGIQLFCPEENLGFGRANNLGITQALQKDCDYVFLLNQDAYVFADTLSQLVHIAQERLAYGILSPVHLNGSGTSLDLKFTEYVLPKYCPGFFSDAVCNNYQQVYNPEFINAAAWLVRADTLRKTGLFNPLFFMYGEDRNLVNRLQYHGYKIGLVPASKVCHDRELRQGKRNSTSIVLLRSTVLWYFLDINKSVLTGYINALKLLLLHFFKGDIKQSLIVFSYFHFRFFSLLQNRNAQKVPGFCLTQALQIVSKNSNVSANSNK